jgi:hypothetical protein
LVELNALAKTVGNYVRGMTQVGFELGTDCCL